MQWRKWRNWRKIASRWRLELDAKSGPLEAGDFGENGDFDEIGNFGKNRHACNGETGETGEKSPASGDLNWMPKVAPWRLAILAKMAILAKTARGLAICGKIFKLDVQKCMQWRKWRNWRKIASHWRFELDAKSGPLEAGDLAKMAILAKLAILAKIAMHAMAKLAKNHQPLVI